MKHFVVKMRVVSGAIIPHILNRIISWLGVILFMSGHFTSGERAPVPIG
jgi:hypothetical protein